MMQAEINRCLRQLIPLFCTSGIWAPEVVLSTDYPPIEPIDSGSRIILYTCSDLAHPPEEVLTILLHKAIHAFHAFRWEQDCCTGSYHTRRFASRAEQLGLRVGWTRRHGWAHTVPERPLLRFFEKLALSETLLSPFRGYRRLKWDCGERCFPSREELIGRPPSGPRLVRSLCVHRRAGSPMVRLAGRWLGPFGFCEGTRLKVEAERGRLTIEAWPEMKR